MQGNDDCLYEIAICLSKNWESLHWECLYLHLLVSFVELFWGAVLG